MASDPTKPLLKLDPPNPGRRRPGGQSKIQLPGKYPLQRQRDRLGPKFQRLRDVLNRGQSLAQLKRDPTALAPESLLVFELQKSHVAFARAIAAVPGLDIYSEDVADILGDDGEELAGHFYLVLPDQAALEQLLRLWELWSNNQELGPDQNVWASVFECLHDLRRWGPRDRVSKEDIAILEDEIELDPDGRIQVEIELVFSEDDDRSDGWRAELEASIVAAGGEVVSTYRLTEIDYDAVLARLPTVEVRGIAERRYESLAGHVEVLLIRPQSDIRVPGEAGDGEPLPIEAVAAKRPAIAAVLDAVPIQNHRGRQYHRTFPSRGATTPTPAASIRFLLWLPIHAPSCPHHGLWPIAQAK